jgi:hypothetical protein
MPKGRAELELLFNNWFVKHLSRTWVAQQSVTKIISATIMNLVKPKAGVE